MELSRNFELMIPDYWRNVHTFANAFSEAHNVLTDRTHQTDALTYYESYYVQTEAPAERRAKGVLLLCTL